MTREQAVRQLIGEYADQRARNLREERRRAAEAAEKDPGIARLLDERQSLLDAAVRQAVHNPAQIGERVATLEGRMRALNDQLAATLAAQGFVADYLEPVYRCALCRDTGEVGTPLHRWCACFEQRLVELLCSEVGMAALRVENFDTFNLDIFPDDEEVLPGMLPGKRLTQRLHMQRVLAVCQRYADDFPNTDRRNLLLLGPSGLGKSFLMNCIAHRVLSRGYTVMRITAPKLVEAMRRYHYNGENADLLAQWTGAQLLVIDDLGAEPMIENVTIVYLFNLINERMVTRRHTLLSTNLSNSELVQAYTERLASRLLDAHTTLVLPFAGRDLRLMRRA